MDLLTKVKMAVAFKNISQRELASNIGMSPANLNIRLQRQKFTPEELEQIAEGMGAKYVYYFEFPDGTKI